MSIIKAYESALTGLAACDLHALLDTLKTRLSLESNFTEQAKIRWRIEAVRDEMRKRQIQTVSE
jgi:hypothetical protein